MAESAGSFSGFPIEAFDFYETLEANNTRVWWADHKADYLRLIREPLANLLAELSEEFGQPHIFRPHRDARFSKDKSPIKDHQGGTVEVEDAIAYYVQVSARGLLVAGGWYAPAGQQLARYRESVDGPVGARLEPIMSSISGHFEIDGRKMKTHPRGFGADHPRIDLMRNRALVATRAYPVEPWLGTRKALTTVRSDWRALRPMVDWLADHVGPATEPGGDM